MAGATERAEAAVPGGEVSGAGRRLPACAETCRSPACRLIGSGSPAGADFIVIGGGVIGCSIAYHLAETGASVVVVERGRVGGQSSGAAAGMLAPLSEAHGPGPFLDLGLAGLGLFPDFVARLREETGLDAGYVSSGLLRVALDEEGERALRERVAWQQAAGRAVEWLDGASAREAEPGLDPAVRAAAWYSDEHHVQSPWLVRALAAAAARRGVRFVEGAEAVGFSTAGSRVVGVRTAGSGLEFDTVPGGHVVVAAGAWTAQLGRHLGVELPVFPCRGQILALGQTAPALRRIVFTDGGYALVKADGTIIVGATEEPAGFDSRVTVGGLAYLSGLAPRLAPALAGAFFQGAWAGLRPASADGLPLIGPLPGWDGVTVAAGHYRNGILLSPITGALVAGMLAGGRSRSAAVSVTPFHPGRFSALRCG